jgi:hypothetical protein
MAFFVGSAAWMGYVGDIDGLWAEADCVMVIVPMALFCWFIYHTSAASLQRKREWEERLLQKRQEQLERSHNRRG